MSELLLELFSEEIPARLQVKAAKDLQNLICAHMKDAGLSYTQPQSFATPRRLTVVLDGIPARSADSEEERKGPRVGAPDKAVTGFLKAAGLASLDDCAIREDKKGSYYVAVKSTAGRPAEEVISEAVELAIAKLPWPKSMRWGSGRLRWIRPLHSILCVLDGTVVPFEIGGIKSSNTTFGHRFMAPDPLRIHSFSDYQKKLAAAHVVLASKDRAQRIKADAIKLADANGLELIEDDALLVESAGLNEWPVPLLGRFDEAFLSVPPEVIVTSLKSHQKCFSLRPQGAGAAKSDPAALACSLNFRAQNRLANRFILVSNLAAKDQGAAITKGNERVIHARLSDAKFFWDQDLATWAKARDKDAFEQTILSRFDAITFHEKLGSQRARIDRIISLAKDIAPFVDANEAETEDVARLAKADLVSEMVLEFPELQGLMGKYYALSNCYKPHIAQAVEDHYKPQGPGDLVPREPVAIAVALADKLDVLKGFWSINEKPTGSKDPFALRRAALGVIRILLENKLRLPLSAFSINHDLLGFFADRLKVYLRDQGARHDLIDAVFALGNQDDLLMIVKRVDALGAFLKSKDGEVLLAGVKRAANILRIEEKKDGTKFTGAAEEGLLQQEEEKALFAAIRRTSETAEQAVEGENFEKAMQAMSALRAPVDAFFDTVTVNDEDPALRKNRLILLGNIREATLKVADFSKIEGS